MSSARLSCAASKYHERTLRIRSAESGFCMCLAMLANSPSGRAIQRDSSQMNATESSSSGSVLLAVAMSRAFRGCSVVSTGRCAMMLQPVLGTGA
ncbi:hypothetical protein D9M68_763140 [compost metagenome]